MVILSVMLSSIVYSQEMATTESGKKVKLNSNNTWEYYSENSSKNSELTSDDLKEYSNSISTDLLDPPTKLFKDGEDNLVKVKVKFSASSDRFKETDFERINLMYNTSLDWTKRKLKNPYSFEPKEMDLSYDDDNGIWWCRIKYVAKNSYGGEVAGSSFFTYPMEKVYRPYSDDELLDITSKRKKKKK